MHTRSTLLCRTVGQLGILTSAAATLAPYTTMLPDLGELIAIASPTLLALNLLELLFVPAALAVCWASTHPRHQRLTLAGCGGLACLLFSQLALMQAATGLNTLWGASYLLSTVVFPLGSVGLLAASHHRRLHFHQHGHELGIGRHRGLGLGCRWIVGIALALTAVSTLAVWSARLPSIFEISVAAACALYAIPRWANPFTAPWIPVAAMLTTLVALHDEFSLALLALGPIPTIPSHESVFAGISALTALILAVRWATRAHRTRHAASDTR